MPIKITIKTARAFPWLDRGKNLQRMKAPGTRKAATRTKVVETVKRIGAIQVFQLKTT